MFYKNVTVGLLLLIGQLKSYKDMETTISYQVDLIRLIKIIPCC